MTLLHWRDKRMIKTMHHLPPDGSKLNVCAYARVSSDRSEAEMSLDNQIDYYTTLILSNPDWEYCGVYADEGISGTSLLNRKQFKIMVDKALKGMIDIILVKSISRFGRNIVDVIGAINKLRTMGVEVYFERENISSLDVTSTIALSMYAQLAESEAISMSQNMTWAIDKRMKAGKYYIPVNEMLGYRYDPEGNLYIVESEAKIIREIFSMYIQGLSLLFIARTMMEKGYKTGVGSSNWNEKTITRILLNEKYVGDCSMHKTFSAKLSARTQVVNRGEKDAYYVKDGHPAIISRETWDEACAIRERRRIQFKHERGETKAPFKEESYFGVCAHCGRNYFIKRLKNGNNIRYTLTCSANKATLTCRESESVFVEDLKDIILAQINVIKGDMISFKKELKKAFIIDTTAIQQRLDEVNNRINEFKIRIETPSIKIDDAFLALKREILKEIDNLMIEKKALENTLLTQTNNESMIKEILESAEKLSCTDREQKYKFFFKKMIVKSRTDLTFIIGNDDVSKLDLLNLPKLFKGTYKIKVRAQFYTVNFGVFFNA